MKVSSLLTKISQRINEPYIAFDAKNSTKDEIFFVYTVPERLEYIRIAYNKLCRILTQLMRNKAPYFIEPTIKKEYTYEGNGKFVVEDYKKVYSVYCTYTNLDNPDDIKTIKAREMPDTHLDKLKDMNTITNANFALKNIYYLLGEREIEIFPKNTETYTINSIEFTYVPDILVLKEDSELFLTGEYEDLLVDLACIEAMKDINRGDKYQLLMNDFNAQLNMIANFTQLKEFKSE